MSEQTRQNGSNGSAERDGSPPPVHYTGAPGDERGDGLAVPLPTCRHPNHTLV